MHYAPETTGNAPYTTGLAEGLRERGHQVHVLTGLPHYPEWKVAPGYTGRRRYDEGDDSLSIARLRHHVPSQPRAWGRIRMETSFGSHLLTARWPSVDAVVCVSPALLSTAMAVARVRAGRRRPPVGVWVQDLYSRGVVETAVVTGRAAKLALRFEGRVLKSADGVAVIHDRFKSYVVGDLGVPTDAVTVIRNWTHLQPFELPDRAAARRRLGWADDDIVVLHAGNMGVKQGLENVVEAARLVRDDGPRIRFVLLGDGNQRARIAELGRGVAALDFVDPLPGAEFQAALGAADVLLVNEQPGVGEMAVPSKITSYFTSGNPVLAATDLGSITAQEITTSGGGLVVPAGDPAALLDAAARLGRDQALARELGAAGRRFCAETLSRDHAIDQYDRWISGLVKGAK